MRTMAVSDHLGRARGEDIARDPAIRNTPLVEIAKKADRVVPFDDVLPLRD